MMIPTNWHLFSGYHGTVEPPQGAHRLRVGGWTTNHWCERLLGLCGNFVQTLWHRRSHQIQLDLQQCLGYPLVNVYITMENHHVINGKIHYFDWVIFQFANCKRLPEGKLHIHPRLLLKILKKFTNPPHCWWISCGETSGHTNHGETSRKVF